MTSFSANSSYAFVEKSPLEVNVWTSANGGTELIQLLTKDHWHTALLSRIVSVLCSQFFYVVDAKYKCTPPT